ncbi:hypothetical protein [Bradyrhizobium sp. Leo170]|uniref:hypothetical protein n=1 Tax=Bradyrhizobium sp. Leo170 TaxID=1571199 RepID=UPI00102E4F30|nr:hypothetical protein [Bradyrhizobium sp. Leo170]TAI66001.1 hypothetical protein CWO89_10570 [Bradyrhizobium sp. Leo170]
MEDLILAFVTFAASICFLNHLAHAGMDAFVIVVALVSMPVVGYLAYERGRSQRRWVWIAAAIGPLAIPLLYFLPQHPASEERIMPVGKSSAWLY